MADRSVELLVKEATPIHVAILFVCRSCPGAEMYLPHPACVFDGNARALVNNVVFYLKGNLVFAIDCSTRTAAILE